MTVIILSYALGSVALGVLLGKLLKRAAKVGNVQPQIECRSPQRERYDERLAPAAARSARLIPNSNET